MDSVAVEQLAGPAPVGFAAGLPALGSELGLAAYEMKNILFIHNIIKD